MPFMPAYFQSYKKKKKMDNDSWIITAERYTKCKPTKPGHLSASISGPQDQTKFSQGQIRNQI